MTLTTLKAKLDGSFSTAFTVTTASTGAVVATCTFHKVRSEGAITLATPHASYAVTHKTASRAWELRAQGDAGDAESDAKDGEVVIAATKPRWTSSAIELRRGAELFHLKSESRWSMRSAYVLTRGDVQVGSFKSEGVFKRGYDISFAEDVGVELVIFCQWLVTLMVKQGQAGAGGAAAGAV